MNDGLVIAFQSVARLREESSRQLRELEKQLTRIILVNNKRDAVRRAFDVEYELTGDTKITSNLLEALGLDEESFIDEEESKDGSADGPVELGVKATNVNAYAAVVIANLGALYGLVRIEHSVGWWAVFAVYILTIAILAALSDRS